jgi:hypothetical protein
MFDLANSSPALRPKRHIVHRNINFNPSEICHYKGAAPQDQGRKTAVEAAPSSRKYNHGAKFAQANANKCKQMLVNLLAFASVCFCESGLFKGLRAKK